jgi:mRNA-degrading endonuclease RelE of RelBE toxin-antitoxin system
MSYNLFTSKRFVKELKRLNKKYPSLKSDLLLLKENLKLNPKLGQLLGKNCYKVRLNITSKGKGKSGSARVITFVFFAKEIVYLVSIFD